MKTFHNTMKSALVAAAMAVASQQSFAANVSVTLTNLTHGSYFTPLFFIAHPSEADLFEVGTEAGEAIQAVAEGGTLDGVIAIAESISAPTIENPAAGLLAPGASVTSENWDTGDGNTQLSVVSMVLPSNDAFVGLDSWTIPSTPGTYTITLNAYDAGTEANDEVVLEGSGVSGVLGIPANPGMNGGQNATGVTTQEANATVHIHRGILGDTDANGGVSDLDSRIHRWLNPVARLVITVQ